MNKKIFLILLLYFVFDIIYGLLCGNLLVGLSPLVFAYLFFLISNVRKFPVTDYIKLRYRTFNAIYKVYLVKALYSVVVFSLGIVVCHIITLSCLSIQFGILEIVRYFIFLFINFMVIQYAMIIDKFSNKKLLITILLIGIGFTLSLLPTPFSLFSFVMYPLINSISINIIVVLVGVYVSILYILNTLRGGRK